MSKAQQELAVVPLPTPEIQVLSFGVELPASILQGLEEPDLKRPPPSPCIITGTISIFQKSVMIWFGWGHQEPPQNYPVAPSSSSTTVVGAALDRSMGPLMVAMPRTKYQGAFADPEGSSSKLIGSTDDTASGGGDGQQDATETEMIARQMATRLSQRLQRPIFCSCSFQHPPEGLEIGVDPSMVRQRAAAMAEKRIREILSSQEKQTTSSS